MSNKTLYFYYLLLALLIIFFHVDYGFNKKVYTVGKLESITEVFDELAVQEYHIAKINYNGDIIEVNVLSNYMDSKEIGNNVVIIKEVGYFTGLGYSTKSE